MAPPTPWLLTQAFVGLSVAELAYSTAFGIAICTLPLYVTGPVGSGESGTGFGVRRPGTVAPRWQCGPRSLRRFCRSRPAIPLSLAFFTSLAAVSGFLASASLHSEEIELSNTSLALFLSGVVVVVCRTGCPCCPWPQPPWQLIGEGLALMAFVPGPGGPDGVVVRAVGVPFSTLAFFAAAAGIAFAGAAWTVHLSRRAGRSP